MREAAEALRLTAQDLKQLGVIDRILPEPVGGAHRETAQMISETGKAIEEELKALDGLSGEELVAQRRAKFLKMGREGLA